MNLKDLQIKKSYDSDNDNILNDFYIPVLSNAISYKRLAGFFSSSSLSVAARGISKFIMNGGQMQMLTCAQLQYKDIKIIEQACKEPEKIIEEKFLIEIDEIEDEFIRDHVRALGWMVASKKLEIKIAVVVSDKSIPLNSSEVQRTGIFHQKVGILEDQKNNKLSFSGSQNESANAWLNNIEEIKIFRDWIDEEKDFFEADLQKFYKYWTGNTKRTKILEISEAIKKKLIKIAPREIGELRLEKYYVDDLITTNKKEPVIKLRPYQHHAIEEWKKNNYQGIFEMATGTGKTFTALGCLNNLDKTKEKLITVISAPYSHLVKQWNREVDCFGIRNEKIIADGSNSRWKNKLSDNVLDIKNGLKNKIIVLTTHDTFSSDTFRKIIKKPQTDLFLIVDEVHGAGASKRKKGLLEEYQFRLGLSATPSRWFDDLGTEDLFRYFNCEVTPELKATFTFPLEKAINTINPDTGKSYLTPYIYNPYFIELTDEEMDEYIKQTRKIVKIYQMAKSQKEKEEYYSLLLMKRQQIVVNAAEKFEMFQKILENLQKNKDIKHCLLYCSPGQIVKAQETLNSKRITQHKFTNIESDSPRDEYGGQSERGYLLNEFSKGNYDMLVAMKCLDEGVDVPTARTAIILASSGNPKEYIQRRGRILRRCEGKEHATIYDILVLSQQNKNLPQELLQIEKKIIRKELKRYNEFANIAMNKLECLNKISKIEIDLINR